MSHPWPTVKGAELYEFVRGVSFPKEAATAVASSKTTAILRAGNLDWGRITLDDLLHVPNELVKPEQMLRPGDLVVAMSSGSASVVGKVAPVVGELPNTAFGAFCGVIRCRKQEMVPWLTWYYQSPVYRSWLRMVSSGTNINNLKASSFLELDIPLPPIGEQQRTVARIEELMERSRRVRAPLQESKSSLSGLIKSGLETAFSGDLTRDWRDAHPDSEGPLELLQRVRSSKDERQSNGPAEPREQGISNLPRLPESWCWTHLGELIGNIEAGKSPKAQGRPADPDEVGVLKVSALSWGKFLPQENKALLPGFNPTGIPHVQAGDLLISRANTKELVGAVVYVEQDYPNLVLSDKTLRLVPASPDVRGAYLVYALRTQIVRRLFEEATGTSDSMRNLSQRKILEAPVALAPLAEQEVIVRRLRAIDRFVQQATLQVEGVLARIAELDQSILAQAFLGGM